MIDGDVKTLKLSNIIYVVDGASQVTSHHKRLTQIQYFNKAEVTEQLLIGRVKQAQQDKTDSRETSLTYCTSQTLLVKYSSHPFPYPVSFQLQ